MCKIAKYDLLPIQIGRHQNAIYVVSEFLLNLVFITKTIYFDVPLAYVFGVAFGHMNANTGRMQTANYRQTLETWSRSDGLRMS